MPGSVLDQRQENNPADPPPNQLQGSSPQPTLGEPPLSGENAGRTTTEVSQPTSTESPAITTPSSGQVLQGASGGNCASSPGACLSPGVIAGAAVGAAVGAAILTFIVTFMFFRRKSRKVHRHGKNRSGSGGFSSRNEKTLPENLPEGNDVVLAALTWQKHLPQSADDKTMRSTVKTLFDQVELHVENFYQEAAITMTEGLQAELLRVDSPHLSASVVTLLPHARSQTALIKHCLLSYIVASISTDDSSVQSLLPAEFAMLPHLARTTRAEKPGFDQALSQWRALSAYLRPSPKNDQTYLSQREASANAAAAVFSSAFAPWARSAYSDSTRRQNVAEIFKSAAEVGILIFSQPSTFVYQWHVAKDNRRGSSFVVTPAFLKVADENANPLPRPQTMIKMATEGT